MTLEIVQSEDGSFTAYSKKFDEHYHSLKDGAYTEALYKHVIPAFKYHKNKKELHILDICFGLGINTLVTIDYIKKQDLDIKLFIYSPEFDKELLQNLKNFQYPKELVNYNYIIDILVNRGLYKDNNIEIELFIGDAREYIRLLDFNSIDIVYQDAFSPLKNRTLWSVEYFKDIERLLKQDGILTTYSVSTDARLSMWENGLNIFEYSNEKTRKGTIASKFIIKDLKEIDMELKKKRNPHAKAYID